MRIVRGAWDGIVTRLAGNEIFDRNLDFHGTGIHSFLQYRTCGNRETRHRVATWDTKANGLRRFAQLVETDIARNAFILPIRSYTTAWKGALSADAYKSEGV